MRAFFIILVLVLSAWSCGTRQQSGSYQSYHVENYSFVLDSIKKSGTDVGNFDIVIFTLDEGEKDTVMFAPLNRKEKTIGSIQIRKDSLFNVQIYTGW